jgi:hypothetical protein
VVRQSLDISYFGYFCKLFCGTHLSVFFPFSFSPLSLHCHRCSGRLAAGVPCSGRLPCSSIDLPSAGELRPAMEELRRDPTKRGGWARSASHAPASSGQAGGRGGLPCAGRHPLPWNRHLRRAPAKLDGRARSASIAPASSGQAGRAGSARARASSSTARGASMRRRRHPLPLRRKRMELTSGPP